MPEMNVEIVEDHESLGRAAARFVSRLIIRKPKGVLALPTGRTPEPLYSFLTEFYRNGLLNFAHTHLFLLDDFYGLPREHPESFRAYIKERLVSQVNVPSDRFHTFPIEPEASQDAEKVCLNYEEDTRRLGGLDLVILGIGRNGHLAYNEPGTPFERRTHLAELTQQTREKLRRRFAPEDPPRFAWTLGLKTIMQARRILLLASGKEKSSIIAKALTGPITQEIPASVLQLHPHTHAILDRAAAQELDTKLV